MSILNVIMFNEADFICFQSLFDQDEYEDEYDGENVDQRHHEDTDSHEKCFRSNVKAFHDSFEEAGNPFEEGDVLTLSGPGFSEHPQAEGGLN